MHVRSSRAPRGAALVSLLVVLPLARCACPTPEPPPLRGVEVGTVVGEAFIEGEPVSGAVVTVLGLPIEEVTEKGKKFVLEAVPLGTHEITIRHDALDQAIRFPVEVKTAFQTVILDEATTTLSPAATARGSVEVDTPALAAVYLVGGGPEQVATPGDDGSFVLAGLPVGAARLAVSAPGFDTAFVELALAPGDNDVPPVTLSASVVNNLSLAGQVQLVGETDHRGITVRLNDGAFVASTAADGTFQFSGLSPGLVNLKASRPGFRTVELATIALDAGGGSFGIVPMFLTPGEDPAGDDGPAPGDELFADIEAPAAGERILVDDEVILQVELTGNVAAAVDEADIVWGFRFHDSTDEPVELGRGVVVTTADLPVGTLDIVVSASGGGLLAEDSVTVVVDDVALEPVFTASISAGAVGGLAVPSVNVLPDRVSVDIAQTQPVILRATIAHPIEGDIADRAQWTSDTGILISGAEADLATLPVGTHDFTISVSDLAGRVGSSRAVITVAPFTFTLTARAPGLDNTAAPPPPYFVEQGLPFEVQIEHPFQTAFPTSSIKWFDADNRQVASGRAGRTFGLPEGPGVLRVEVQDALGNLASTSTQFVLQSVSFQVSLLAPAEGTDVLEGEAVTGAVSVVHSLVPSQIPPSALQVRWLSSIQGLLADSAGTTVFGVDDTPSFGSLVPGLHTLTATVSDGSTVASAARAVRVRSPGVSASVSAPADGTVFFPSQPVSFAAVTSIDGAVANRLRITWKIDGVEFDAAWDDYGTDPASLARQTINLGTYTPGAGLFADARLAPGRHSVELFVRLDDVDPGLGCVDIVSRAECARFTIELVDQNVDLCPGGTNRTVSAPETWSGVRRLNCVLTITSTVDVVPGTRIVVDALAGNPNGRTITIGDNGVFRVGDIDAAEPVVIEPQGALTGVGTWRGIQLVTQPTGAATVIIENTILRSASDALDDNGTFQGPLTTLELRRFHVERSGRLWRDFCPDVVEDVSLDNTGVSASVEAILESSGRLECASPRTYKDLVLKNVDSGLVVGALGVLTLERAVFEDVRDRGIDSFTSNVAPSQDFLITIVDSIFRRVGRAGNQPAILTRGCERLRVERSAFFDNAVVWDDNGIGSCELYTRPDRRIDVAGSVFQGNTTVFAVENRGGQPPLEVHTSMFSGNTTDVQMVNDGPDMNAQGNFVGGAGDFSTAGGVLRSLPAGLVANLPRLSDVFDNVGQERVVHVDNPLDTFTLDPRATPLTFLRAPRQAEHIPAGGCVRVEPDSSYGPIADVASCALFLLDDNDGRTPVDLDASGCLTTTPPPGEHRVLAECTVLATGVVEEHVGRFLVDATRRSGATRPGVETWSGVIELDGDVTVPFGSTLVIEPGTLVRFASSDRLRGERYPNNVDGPNGENTSGSVDDDGTNAPNRGFGDRTLVDLFVDGTLVAEGTAGAPIRFESVSGVSLAAQWGGVRIGKLGAATFDFVEMDGASVAIHGELVPNDLASAPQFSVTNTTVTASTHGIRGVCPSIFADNTMTDVVAPFSQAHCAESLTILRSDFDRIGNPAQTNGSNAFFLGTYASGPESIIVTFDQSTLSRGFGSPGDAAFVQKGQSEVALVVVRDSSIDNFQFVTEYEADQGDSNAYSTRIERSLITNFFSILDTGSFFPTSLEIVQSELRNGDELMNAGNQARALVVTDSRLVDVAIPLDDVDLDQVFTIAITGSQIENALTVFHLDMSSPAFDSVFNIDLSGNNFLGTVNEVLKFRQGTTFFAGGTSSRNVTANIDMTGCHFGAAATAAQIEAEILDPQADASGADTIKGRTSYTGFSTTPLTLNLLP